MKRTGRHLPLYLSAPHPCSYLPDRLSNTLFADPSAVMDMATYSELLQYGFRRSGSIVYAPHCDQCRQCVSLRVPVDEFRPRRSQRRTLSCNADITVRERPPQFDPEHYALYQRYTAARHEDGDMAGASPADYMGFLHADWCETEFLEFRLEGRLVAVAVTDRPADGLSAVYTFFDPRLAGRSPGTLAILRQIERARTLGLPYLYLGYWIRDCRKMAYKLDFRPTELWRDEHWERLGPGETPPE